MVAPSQRLGEQQRYCENRHKGKKSLGCDIWAALTLIQLQILISTEHASTLQNTY